MRRTKNRKTFDYNKQEEPIILSKALMDALLKQDNPADCIALYCFYYYTAKWQRTNKIKAVTEYAMKGLSWTKTKLRKAKKQLISLGLVKDDVTISSNDGRITGHYIKINFIWSKHQGYDFPPPGETHPVVKRTRNALSSNNINALSSSSYVTTSLFNSFWRLYPKNASKGSALNAWIKLCNKPAAEKPTWREIKTAIIAQKKTPQWSNKKYIANASTWLNQNRWMDDPNEMTYCGNKDKPTRIMDNGEWYYLDDKGRYKNRNDEYYINE